MSAGRTLALLGGADLQSPIAWRGGHAISRGAFLAHAEALAHRLPQSASHVLNLCDDRYHFMVALAAVLLRGYTALLPPSNAPRAIKEIREDWGAFSVDDAVVALVSCPSEPAGHIPSVDRDRDAVILFTSGTTGQPTPQAKSWAELYGATRLALKRFDLGAGSHQIVATVPPQHSYGFESSILYAMLGSASVHAGRPLYAADVQAALASVKVPRILVTTPMHLSVCVRAGLNWPDVKLVLSATAPLTPDLAQACEETLGAPLQEIYGCSEVGAIASRRPCTDTLWLPYDGVQLEQAGNDVYVRGPHLVGRRRLADYVNVECDGRFELRGRKSDEIKIAGKRINVAELNRRLLAIEGVVDGAFVPPGEDGQSRLAAVAVAPTLSEAEIRSRLAEVVDPVFLPRPLILVPSLERTAIGKLRRAELLRLLAERNVDRSVCS